MEREEKKPSLLKVLFLILFVIAGVFMVSFQKKIVFYSGFHRLQAEAVFKTGKKVMIGLKMAPRKIIPQIKRDLKIDFDQLESLRIFGKLLIEKSDYYWLGISYSVPASFSIDSRVVFSPDRSKQIGRFYLDRGLHGFQLKIRPASGKKEFLFMWKKSQEENWKAIRQDFFYSDSALQYSIGQLNDFRKKARISRAIYSSLVYLFMILFIIFSFGYIDRSVSEFSPDPKPGNIRNGFPIPGRETRSRFFEIDVTKGFAAFLMIAAHAPGGGAVLSMGNFGASLFFFCSGMNTIIFLDRTRHLRGINWYHLFFMLLLFFGGYTQIVIAHVEAGKLVPEFLQFIALGILLVSFLFKTFKNPRYIGYMFVLPFLIHLGFKYNFLPDLHLSRSVLDFFIGKHVFPLFPWSGFLLFGVFMFNVREKPKTRAIILTVTGLASILTIFIFRIPPSLYDMSISYIFLSLFVLAFLFSGFSRMELKSASGMYSVLRTNLALVGRNSLMFVYLHYFVLFYFLPAIPSESPVLELVFQSLIAFVLCTFFILVYEKIKFAYSFLIPVLLITSMLFFLRQANIFDRARDLRLIDMVVGIFFAFLYVQLRGKFRKFLKKS